MGESDRQHQPAVGPYAQWAEIYLTHGLRPFPVNGKRPHVRRFAGQAPSADTIRLWTRKFPLANLGLPTAREGLMVLDADDAEAIALFEAVAGPTPLRVGTLRGEHWYYANPMGKKGGPSPRDGPSFDIKAAGPADYVLLPGSWNGQNIYRLLECEGDEMIVEFAHRLRDLPVLEQAAYQELMQRPAGHALSRPRLASPETPTLLTMGEIPEGRRNSSLFQAACSNAHRMRETYGDGMLGIAALADWVSTLNAMLCIPPLEDAEVDEIVRSAWQRTLNGVNRPCTRFSPNMGRILKRTGARRLRSLVLWGLLSQQDVDRRDLELAPVRLAATVANWKRHDAEVAIKGLLDLGVLKALHIGGRGRGNTSRYMLVEPLVSKMCFARAAAAVNGDAAAVALLAFMIDSWGDGA